MRAVVLDTETGKTHAVDGISAFQWAENNWSCDCNRNYFDVETNGEDGICEGCHRFLVIAAEFNTTPDENGEQMDYQEYSLRELNACYPIELLWKFLPAELIA